MVINRCIDPMSKIKIKDWAANSSLPTLKDTGFQEYDEYDIYRELDRLDRLENNMQDFILQLTEK